MFADVLIVYCCIITLNTDRYRYSRNMGELYKLYHFRKVLTHPSRHMPLTISYLIQSLLYHLKFPVVLAQVYYLRCIIPVVLTQTFQMYYPRYNIKDISPSTHRPILTTLEILLQAYYSRHSHYRARL